MIAWEDREPSTVPLAPPSPTGAPHLGGIYTWMLLDAARRTAQHFGGDAHLPQSWNMSSRRLEPTFGHDPEGFARYCGLAVSNAVATLEGFGDLDEVFRRAATVAWIPGYGIRRLRSLTDVHPLIRVGHPRRNLGIPSPLHDGEILDPRLVGALGPSLLRRLGLNGPIVAAAEFDI